MSEWILVSVQNQHIHWQNKGHYGLLDTWTPEEENRGLRVFVSTGPSSWGWILNVGDWLQYAQRFPTQAEAQEALEAQSYPAHIVHGPIGEPVRVDDPRLVIHRERHAERMEQQRMAVNRARSRHKAAQIGRKR